MEHKDLPKGTTVRKLVRPSMRSDFLSKVENAKDTVLACMSAGKTLEFPSAWSEFKHAFAKAQSGKCGFCEGLVIGLQYGDIEHFQPKAEIHRLSDDPESWGKERAWASTVRDRETKLSVKPGYWWRAYDWENYLLSCQVCNQQWKQNLYPVDGEFIVFPTTLNPGQPLLLSPFEDFNPANHFSYGRIGEIQGISERGRATIRTCGLDRPSLRLARYKTAKATHEHLDEISGNVTEGDMLNMLRYIARDGHGEQPYCGMVQTIFAQRTGIRWEILDDLIDKLEKRNNPRRELCKC